MKKSLLISSIFCLSLFSRFVGADEALISRDDVKTYIAKTARQTGLSRQFIADTLRASQYKESIINALDKPATKRPWHQFSLHLTAPQMVADGTKFWKENHEILDIISQKYHVDPEIIVAILGIETQYGKNTGRFFAIDALSTIAFYYPRRASYFQDELRDFFILTARENQDPLSLKSSYAGALGMTQFMPSSYLKHAASFQEKNSPDIWNTTEDAIASVANYLKHFGWRKEEMIVSPVTQMNVNAETVAQYLNTPFQQSYSIKDWRAKGIYTENNIPLSRKAILFALDEPDKQTYWFGLHNFYVITRYNKSTLYAMAVTQLAEKIKSNY